MNTENDNPNKTYHQEVAEDIVKGLNKKTIELNDPLNFECVACGKCCYNQDIILNTYDMLQFRREFEKPTFALGIAGLYTVHKGPNSKMPVCLLKFLREPESNISMCPFLRPEFQTELDQVKKDNRPQEEVIEEMKVIVKKNVTLGKTKQVCSIHKNSPTVCKLYPLGRVSVRPKDSGISNTKEEVRFLKLEKDRLFCPEKCFECKNTVKDYLTKNKVTDEFNFQKEYNMLISRFAEIISEQKVFPEYKQLATLLYDFDAIAIYQKLKKQAPTNANLDDVISKNKEAERYFEQFPELDQSLLSKSLDKNASDSLLEYTLSHLTDAYKEYLKVLQQKYA